MPIRLNLLAEAQAEEEMRRRDPVKRAIWGGGILVACALLYYGSLVATTMAKRSELRRMEAALETNKNKYQEIVDNEKSLSEVKDKLEALRHFAQNRFLWGNLLNALQFSTLEDVQLVRMHADQKYAVTEATKAKTSESGRVEIAKPGFVTEQIELTLDAKDSSPAPGDQINKFKAALTKAPFFGAGNTNAPQPTVALKNLAAPTPDPESGRAAVMFSLGCRFPDKVIK